MTKLVLTIRIQRNPSCLSSRCNNENEWYQIHENIIRKSSTKYTAPSTNYGTAGYGSGYGGSPEPGWRLKPSLSFSAWQV